MVKLIPIAFSELRPLIHQAYLGDPELIEQYQKGELPLEECVDYNFEEIKKLLIVYGDGMCLWRVTVADGDEQDAIGYTVTIADTEPPMLFSYAINKEHRCKCVLAGWLAAIEKELGDRYYTALWNKNTRAIEFFKKNGFEAIVKEDNKFTYLVKGDIKDTVLWQSLKESVPA